MQIPQHLLLSIMCATIQTNDGSLLILIIAKLLVRLLSGLTMLNCIRIELGIVINYVCICDDTDRHVTVE
jgi:hypothetical protein